jgi:alanyl-tRNA synthetase
LVAFQEGEYHVPFFDEQGFARKKCKICGEFYWTQVPDQDICGEAPCQEYTFIGNPPTRRGYDLRKMRETFLSFFERRGHKRISPYPVVARWRDDLYFTDASIVDFQPYVTDGIIPPPANPLVISQPCIRFVDIDNVGLTFGRHLTIFEMGGHHAFNYPKKEVYWKDQTIRYHHQFITKELGAKSESVVYKEGVWSGGGNAGPDVEGIIGGFEVCTLVFMNYKVVDGKFVKLPVRTVDTGYGMERYTWLSQGTPSCFHALCKPVLERVLNMAGLTPDEKLLSGYARHSGGMRVEKVANVKKLREGIARKIGVDVDTLHRLITPVESVFAVLDHTKSLVFMLAEGVVPSNVREGYLTRLVLRRTYRLLRLLGVENRLSDIVNLQIDFWSQDFPYLKNLKDEILEVLAIEEEKYRRTLERGATLVGRVCSELKSKGAREIPVSKLVELYDSQGLPPNIVSEIAAKEGIHVPVPDDFYTKVAKRHVTAPKPKITVFEKGLEDKVADLKATRLLYYEDAYMRKFKARVSRVIGGKYVVLNQTAFYPEGGGQPADHGRVSWKTGEARVVDVQKIGNVLVHIIKGGVPKIGVSIEGEIDWSRRISLMRHHTATHILMGAARRVLGEHVWQAGAQKGVDATRLDISHYKRITPEELAEIESLANIVVMENMPVEVSWMPREKAESMYGFRLYQGGVVPGREIRVIKTQDWEVEACGGTHCKSTGEVGFIKIIRTDRIQDGVERLIFSAGVPAVQVAQARGAVLQKVAEIHETGVEKVAEAAQKMTAELKEARREITRLREELTRHEAVRVLTKAKPIANVKLVTQCLKEVTAERLIKLSSELISVEPSLVAVLCSVNETARIVVMAGNQAVKAGVHSGNLAGEIAKLIGGGGSGKPDFGQGGGNLVDKVPEALATVEKVVEKMITKSG